MPEANNIECGEGTLMVDSKDVVRVLEKPFSHYVLLENEHQFQP